MNLGAIYSLTSFYYFGDTVPTASTDTYFTAAAEGVISNIHRKIQDEFDYWFMEAYHMGTISAYGRTMTLPTGFKHEIAPVRMLRFSSDTYTTGTAACSATTTVTGTSTAWESSWSGRKYQISWDSVTWYNILSVTAADTIVLETAGPTTATAAYTIRKCTGAQQLIKMQPGTAVAANHDQNGATSYPLYYDIFDDTMDVYPLPTENIAIDFRYYKFLDRPTVFATHSDALTEHAAQLIAYLSVAELCAALDTDKYALFMDKASDELAVLKKKHTDKTEAGLNGPRYSRTRRGLPTVIYTS